MAKNAPRNAELSVPVPPAYDFIEPDCPLSKIAIDRVHRRYFADPDADVETPPLCTYDDVEAEACAYISESGSNAIYDLCGWFGGVNQTTEDRIRKEIAEAASAIWESRTKFPADKQATVMHNVFQLIRLCNEICKTLTA